MKVFFRFYFQFIFSIFSFALAAAILSGCAKDSGSSSNTNNNPGNGSASGFGFTTLQTLNISGPHNSIYGTNLEIGTVYAKSSADGLYPDQVTLYDKAVSIQDAEGTTVTTDPNNGIAMVINTFRANPQMISSISMGIKVNGKNYMYACDNPYRIFYFCGAGITVDIPGRHVTLTNVDVQSTPTKGVIMRLNGTVSW